MLMHCTQQKVAKSSKFCIEPFCLSHLCQTAKILLLKFYIFSSYWQLEFLIRPRSSEKLSSLYLNLLCNVLML